MFRNLKIRPKMSLVVLMPLLALALVSFIGLRTLNAVQIGGPQYKEVAEAKDLVADILPPPAYLIEAHLATEELVSTADPAARAELISSLAPLKAQYYERREVWRAALVDADEQGLLNQLEAAYKAGDQFWQVIDDKLVPASKAGDLAAMSAIDESELNPAFARHRSLINTTVEQAEARRVRLEAKAGDQVRQEKWRALAAIAILGGLTVLLTFLVARSVVRPIRRLTEAAQAAETELPTAVARAQSGDDAGLPAVDAGESPEFATLAGAMTSMQSTAVGLATEQARIRRNVSVMLGNLARRNQSLVNRTLSFITELEKDERNPETLDNLFKLDHLTTRMRRNAESLLVLSGAEQARTWPRPVEVREVLRASLSEIESFDRVELGSLHPALIRGSSVADLTHLVAELLDNATRFSPADSTVTVTGEQAGDGYMVTIVDRGMGMSPEALAQANRELESMSRLEERTSLVLGLAVVGRLGARNGIAVRLEQSATDGVTARVRLPGSVLHRAASESGAPAVSGPVAARVAPAEAPAAPAPSNGVSAPAIVERERVQRPTVDATANASAGNGAVAAVPARTPVSEPVSSDRDALVARGAASSSDGVALVAGGGGAFAPPAAGSAGTAPATRAEATQSATTRARDDRSAQAGAPVAAAPVTAASAQAAAAAAAAAAEATTTSGLARRVPGANLFDGALPPPLPAPTVRRTAESVRDALSNFQDGFERAPRRLPNPETTNEKDDA